MPSKGKKPPPSWAAGGFRASSGGGAAASERRKQDHAEIPHGPECPACFESHPIRGGIFGAVDVEVLKVLNLFEKHGDVESVESYKPETLHAAVEISLLMVGPPSCDFPLVFVAVLLQAMSLSCKTQCPHPRPHNQARTHTHSLMALIFRSAQ